MNGALIGKINELIQPLCNKFRIGICQTDCHKQRILRIDLHLKTFVKLFVEYPIDIKLRIRFFVDIVGYQIASVKKLTAQSA